MADEPLEEVAALWTSSDELRQMRVRSHWRGEGQYADDERWRNIGRGTLRQLRRLLRLLDRDESELNGSTVLEWGPGGGSNLVALAPFADIYFGADISGPNLAECERQAGEIDYDGFRAVHFAGDPDEVRQAVGQPVDVFVSTAVFQHFPSKEYGLEVLKCVAACLGPGAIGMVQIRYDNGDPKYRPTHGSYRERYLTATSYRLDEFWIALTQQSLAPQAIGRFNTSTNYATFLFTKRRPGGTR